MPDVVVADALNKARRALRAARHSKAHARKLGSLERQLHDLEALARSRANQTSRPVGAFNPLVLGVASSSKHFQSQSRPLSPQPDDRNRRSSGDQERHTFGNPGHHAQRLTLLAEDEKVRNNVARVTPIPGKYDVVLHGREDQQVRVKLLGGDSLLASAKQLANLIRERPDARYRGEPIRLLSCWSGITPDGFAQQLADELGVDVIAPNGVLHVFPNGKMAISEAGYLTRWYNSVDAWKTFKPRAEMDF